MSAVALTQRLGAAADVLGVSAPEDRLLVSLLEHCASTGSHAETWLVLCAVTASWPEADDVRQAGRSLRLDGAAAVATELVARALGSAQGDRELDVLVGGVLVDVDFSARHDLNSGVQRVVRRTLPRWRDAGRDVVATAWTEGRDAARTLGASETRRVFDYQDPFDARPEPAPADDADARLVVPWEGTFVLAEVPSGPVCARIAAFGELSGNRLVAIGYDTIPVLDAELRPPAETNSFARYLTAIKHAREVAAISRSSAAEFAGFGSMLASQGLPGPRVSAVPIPTEPVQAGVDLGSEPGERLTLLCVGAREPHKNHRGVLHAAARLWQEGYDFDLEFLGGKGWTMEQVTDYTEHLVARGRPVRHLGRLDDDALAAAYRRADVVVFLSLHEGFGLPAAEALAVGTPVLTTSYGSLAEVAEGGGALLADPRDDDDVTDQLRRLVSDADLRRRLSEAAGERPHRTWDEYADALWRQVVAP